MADQDLDRNEAATPHKLDEARKRGQVVRSPDVTAAVVLATAVAFLFAEGWDGLRALFGFDGLLLAQTSTEALFALATRALRSTLAMLAPFLALVMIAGVLANLAQTGPTFTFKPLAPDAQRLNPVQGLKRVFSLRSLFDLFRASLKLVVLGIVVWLALRSLGPQFHRLAGLSPLGQAHAIVEDAASLGLKLVLALAVLATIDYAYTRHQFARRMRMSRRELKEEVRQREGDPRIRARLRELRRAMLKRAASLRRTAQADVLVTNPTHVAVALQYRHGEMAAPRLVAKGVGAGAAAMRQIASRHDIPVVQNVSLARALFAELEIDRDVPPAHYAQVAKIMVWVIARRGARGAAPAPVPRRGVRLPGAVSARGAA